MVYTSPPIEVVKSETFHAWLSGLRDRQARVRIAARIDRLALGNPGDVKAVGAGISELRINVGPGYRVYFTTRGATAVILLCGGDKGTQPADIRRAGEIANDWKD